VEIPDLRTREPWRIGLIVEPTPFTHVSGYSNRYQEMLRYMQKAEDQIEIVTPDDSQDPPESFLGYPITYTPGFRFSLYNLICLSLDQNLVGMKMIERFKPEVLHVTTPGFICLMSSIYARWFQIPLVLSYHTHLPVYAANYLGFVPFIVDISWLTIKLIHNQADLTLVTSPQLKEEFLEHGIERVEVWRKGIDTESFNPKWRNEETRRMLTDGNPDEMLLLYVGRLGKEKRIQDLRAVLDANPDVRLAIVGTGPYEKDLKQLFEGTKTVFTGVLRGEKLWRAFASADVFCMPSDSETLGFVVLESMASGVPVIGAKAGGIPDLITEGETGFLVPPGDSDLISQHIQMLKADKQRLQRMGRQGRSFAERFSWEKATAMLRNVQYPLAVKHFENDLAIDNPIRRAARISFVSTVGLLATIIVTIGSSIDQMIQKAKGGE